MEKDIKKIELTKQMKSYLLTSISKGFIEKIKFAEMFGFQINDFEGFNFLPSTQTIHDLIDLSKLTDDELKELSRIFKKASKTV